MTTAERSAIEDRRRRLEKKITSFHQKAETYMGIAAMASDKDGTDIPVVVDDWDELNEEDELDDDNEATDEGDSHEEVVCAEKLSLWLPS